MWWPFGHREAPPAQGRKLPCKRNPNGEPFLIADAAIPTVEDATRRSRYLCHRRPEALGTNILIVTPAQSRVIAGRARTGQLATTLVARDNFAIRREVLGRTRSSALVNASFWLKAGDLSKNAGVVGCEPDYFPIRDWPTAEGGGFDATQERTSSRVALLGHTVAQDLFGTIEIDSPSEMDAAAAQTRSLLRQLHHTQPKQPDDFQIQNQKALLDTQRAAANRLGFFLRWIGASALVVSGLGTLGITWIAVKERTREFGTRRALGATSSHIFLQVVSESTALALAGCTAGAFLSWPISRLISRTAGVAFVFSRGAVLIAFTAAAVLNIGFALWLSRRAATLDPTDALRYE